MNTSAKPNSSIHKDITNEANMYHEISQSESKSLELFLGHLFREQDASTPDPEVLGIISSIRAYAISKSKESLITVLDNNPSLNKCLGMNVIFAGSDMSGFISKNDQIRKEP